jgi:hypothetical protein
MSLAAVLYPGPTEHGLEEFFWANYQHHLALIAAVKETHGIVMEQFQIYPPGLDPGESWSRQHQRQHDVMNSVLGIPGSDLSAVDFKDKKAFDGWAWNHFQQHVAAAALCGVPV